MAGVAGKASIHILEKVTYGILSWLSRRRFMLVIFVVEENLI
jgi:hypothetical protein